MSNFNFSSPNFWSATDQKNKMTDLRFPFLLFSTASHLGVFPWASKCPESMRNERAGLESKPQRNCTLPVIASPLPRGVCPDPSSTHCHFSNVVLLQVSNGHTAHLVKNVNRKLFSGWMACAAQKNGHFCWDTTLKPSHSTGSWRLAIN